MWLVWPARLKRKSCPRTRLGNRGQSLPNGFNASQSDPRLAKRDTVLLVYGVTYALPAGSLGADIAVDTMGRLAGLANIVAVKDATGSFQAPMFIVGALMLLSAVLAFSLNTLARPTVPARGNVTNRHAR